MDSPFFSGRNCIIIFEDKNEVRSFTDIWESGKWKEGKRIDAALKAGGRSARPLKDSADAKYGDGRGEIKWCTRRESNPHAFRA
jgi:hypothetical protein